MPSYYTSHIDFKILGIMRHKAFRRNSTTASAATSSKERSKKRWRNRGMNSNQTSSSAGLNSQAPLKKRPFCQGNALYGTGSFKILFIYIETAP
jgi:hypothetical protein